VTFGNVDINDVTSPWRRCAAASAFAKGVMGGNADLRSMLLRGAPPFLEKKY